LCIRTWCGGACGAMHERTFIAAIIALDVMLVLSGGAMGWGYGSRGGIAQGLLALLFISLIGGFAIYHLNVFVLDLAETATSERDGVRVAVAFVAAVLIGGLAAI